jgi:hypothetical protein
MAEVQSHGNQYEELVIQEVTGMDKKNYDSTKKNGYTSVWDIERGEYSDSDISIKTTGNNTICMGDIRRMRTHNNYSLIVGVYNQDGNYKKFNKQYTFNITDNDICRLWGNMELEVIETFVNYVKNIPYGKEGQLSTKEYRNALLNEIYDNSALMTINAKVDSKKQRRVQCSMKLDELISSGVKYEVKDIDITIQSSSRKFNK